MKRDERAPRAQMWIEKDKRITLSTCGPLQTYVEVDTRTGKVTTKTFIKTTRDE